MEFRSSKCVYMGVSLTHKGHTCMNQVGKIFISKYVIFHEEEFPFKVGFTTVGNSFLTSPDTSEIILSLPTTKLHIPSITNSNFKDSIGSQQQQPIINTTDPHSNSSTPSSLYVHDQQLNMVPSQSVILSSELVSHHNNDINASTPNVSHMSDTDVYHSSPGIPFQLDQPLALHHQPTSPSSSSLNIMSNKTS